MRVLWRGFPSMGIPRRQISCLHDVLLQIDGLLFVLSRRLILLDDLSR